MERYYYRIGTVQEGPLTINELCELARQKVIVPDTPINKEFDKIWKEASQFPALQPIFTGLIAEHYAKLKQREAAMREKETALNNTAAKIANGETVPSNVLLNSILKHTQINGMVLERIAFRTGFLLAIIIGLLILFFCGGLATLELRHRPY